MKKCRRFWGRMTPLEKLILVATMVFGLAVAPMYAWSKNITTPVTPSADLSVGGLPPCLYFTGTSTATTPDDLVFTLPAGFSPREVTFIPDLGSDSTAVQWFYGQASGTAFTHMNGSTLTTGLDFHANGTANINVTTATSQQITISNEAQTESATFFLKVCR